MLSFATFFDINYLPRGLALLNSLTRHCSKPFKLYVLALDEQVKSYFEKQENQNVIIIQQQDLEGFYPELLTAKANRSKIEYYFTLSPYLPLYVLNHFSRVEQVTSMDADICFFSDPQSIFEKYEHSSVLITPHNFPAGLQHLEKYGLYNVSFQSFKNDEAGLASLNNWRQQCLEWCYDKYDEANNRFADQKYLDNWQENFSGVQSIEIPGTGLAPWNVGNHQLTIVNKNILVDGEPLIYYHFHDLRLVNTYLASHNLEHYGVEPKQKALELIYHAYLKQLVKFQKAISINDGNILRNNAGQYSSGAMEKVIAHNGYFFNNSLIKHININRGISRFKNKFRWPR